MSQPEPILIPPEIIVAGGETFVAYKKDGSNESVLIRLVPVKKLESYGQLLDLVMELVEFVCDKPVGWAETLHEDSLYEIDDRARKWNNPRLDRFIERQIKTVQQSKPIMARVETAAAVSSSTNSSGP